jgi:two-component system, LytTR family, response regulator AgrA
MSYPVFICDDDPDQIAQVTDTLKRAEQILSDEEKVRFDLASQNNYQDAKDYLLSHPVDGGIYFLDVELGQEVDADNGFDLAELIKKQDDRAQIIFLTSHADLSIITYRRRGWDRSTISSKARIPWPSVGGSWKPWKWLWISCIRIL